MQLAPEDWPTEDRAHRRAIGHPLWRATDWTIYDDRGRLLPLRQREVAFEAIQETRRHLDMTADWVAREALRARKIDAIAESTAGGTTLHRRDDLAERAWLPRITDHTHHCKEARA